MQPNNQNAEVLLELINSASVFLYPPYLLILQEIKTKIFFFKIKNNVDMWNIELNVLIIKYLQNVQSGIYMEYLL
jgi:hypothetical protein